jgi:hypothetical protein
MIDIDVNYDTCWWSLLFRKDMGGRVVNANDTSSHPA